MRAAIVAPLMFKVNPSLTIIRLFPVNITFSKCDSLIHVSEI